MFSQACESNMRTVLTDDNGPRPKLRTMIRAAGGEKPYCADVGFGVDVEREVL